MRAIVVIVSSTLLVAACGGRDPIVSSPARGARHPDYAVSFPSVGSPNRELNPGLVPTSTSPGGPGVGGIAVPPPEPAPPSCGILPSGEAMADAPACTESVVATDLTITSIWTSASALFVASDAGLVFTSADRGATWSQAFASAGDYLTAITGRNEDVLATGGDVADRGSRGSPVGVRLNGNWTESRIPGSLWASSIAASERAVVVAGDLIRVSGDDGNTWNVATAPVASYSAATFANCGELLIAGTFDDGANSGQGTLARSRDDGSTWVGIMVPAGPSAIVAHEDTYVTSHFDGRVSRSTDRGATWSAFQLASRPLRAASMNATGELTITVGDDGTLYYSKDMGTSWSAVSLTADGLMAAAVSSTEPRAYVAGSNGAFFSCAF